jgi:aspartate racemase
VLAQMARGLEVAGADALVMVCNSAHAFAADIRAALERAPLISLIDETVAEVARAAPHVRRVGVLAASACLDARLYQGAFERAGVTTIVPEGELGQRFMALLYRIKAGETGPAQRIEMAAIAQSLARAGAEVIVSGCTEVPLVLGGDDLDLPLVDSTDVLVAAALAFARPDAG